MSKKYQSAKKHDPIDTDVPVPAAIRAAAQRADALHKAAYETSEGSGDEDVTQAAPEVGDKGGDNKPQPSTPEPEKEPEKEPEAAPTPTVEKVEANAPTPSGQDWEHKYNSLMGRYQRQEQIIKQLNERITGMDALIASMKASPAPKNERPASELTFKPISQEDKETFGDEFIDVAQRAALEKVSPEIERLNRTIADLQAKLGHVDNTLRQSGTKTVYEILDAEVPNWREINRDQKFLAWTNLPDPFSGATRISLLKQAFETGDGARVVRFFKGFLNDEAATDPAARVQPNTADPEKGTGKVPLEQFAAPGRAKAPAATSETAPGEKETITRAQIAEFYRRKNQGYWRGNEAEMNALEQRIFKAQAEGRIVD